VDWIATISGSAMDRIDHMTEFAIAGLLAAPDGWRSIVRDIAARWPDVPPLEITFVLVSAAEAISDLLAVDDPSRDVGAHAWRVAALLAADVYAMERLGLPRETAADLFAYWKRYDSFFLNL